jgi:hypothetical protein
VLEGCGKDLGQEAVPGEKGNSVVLYLKKQVSPEPSIQYVLRSF